MGTSINLRLVIYDFLIENFTYCKLRLISNARSDISVLSVVPFKVGEKKFDKTFTPPDLC